LDFLTKPVTSDSPLRNSFLFESVVSKIGSGIKKW